MDFGNMRIMMNKCAQSQETLSSRGVEQQTVLIYEDEQTEISIEPHLNSFYLSGRIKSPLDISHILVQKIVNTLKDAGISFSLDYQEENENGEVTSPEFNIKNTESFLT